MNEFSYSYIDLAKTYFRLSTDAPPRYGETTALGILGHSVGRETIHLIQPKAVFHNSYVLLIGPSTLARKTTIQDLGKDFYSRKRWLPNETSPEKLIMNLSKKPEGYCWMGEFSKLLKGIKGHGYMATMAETYNDLFTCPDYYSRDLVKGTFTCENVYLNLHSTITPEVLKENITSEMFYGGLLPRWLMDNEEPCPKFRGRLPLDVLEMGKILKEVTDAIIKMEKDVCFELDDEALAYFNNEIEKKYIYDEKYRIVGNFAGRYENYVLAFADLYLISDAIGKALNQWKDLKTLKLSDLVQLVDLIKLVNNNTSTKVINSNNRTKFTKYLKNMKSFNKVRCQVPKEYVERAWKIVKPCLDYVRELAVYIDMDKPTAKVRELVKKYKSIGHTKLLRNSNLNIDKFSQAIGTLFQRKEVDTKKIEYTTGGRTYKKLVYVWIAENDTETTKS